MKTVTQCLLLAAASLAACAPSLAHTGDHDQTGIVEYFAHVLAHADHLLPLLAVVAAGLVLRVIARGESTRTRGR